MLKVFMVSAALLLATPVVLGQDSEQEEAAQAAEAEAVVEVEENEDEGPRTMSGMSILGNEEAPKALVIIPWKSSELGADLSLSNTLDDRAQPVDKEVFMRELRFYEIRSGE